MSQCSERDIRMIFWCIICIVRGNLHCCLVFTLLLCHDVTSCWPLALGTTGHMSSLEVDAVALQKLSQRLEIQIVLRFRVWHLLPPDKESRISRYWLLSFVRWKYIDNSNVYEGWHLIRQRGAGQWDKLGTFVAVRPNLGSLNKSTFLQARFSLWKDHFLLYQRLIFDCFISTCLVFTVDRYCRYI